MNDYELECMECGWMGLYQELHCSEEDSKSDKPTEQIKFNLCPDCGGTEFEELEDDDEE